MSKDKEPNNNVKKSEEIDYGYGDAKADTVSQDKVAQVRSQRPRYERRNSVTKFSLDTMKDFKQIQAEEAKKDDLAKTQREESPLEEKPSKKQKLSEQNDKKS